MLVNLKEILAIAEAEKNAVGMFNATGFDSLQAIVSAAEELNRPVILAHAEVHNVWRRQKMQRYPCAYISITACRFR